MNSQNPLFTRRALAKIGALGGAALGATALFPRLAQAQTAAAPGTAAPADTAPTAEPTPTPAPAFAQSDLDIVAFALGLERLESAFYAQVLGAHQARTYLEPRLFQIAQSISADENAHVAALEAVLTSANVELPAAQTYRFPANVFVSPIAFAWFGHTLEDIGIGAYLGAVGAIKSDALRRAAASIYGSESRHAAILRQNAGFQSAPRYFESPLSVAQVTALVAPYIA